MSLNFGRAVLCVHIFLILILITAQNELRQFNVALLMVERSSTIRFDLEHIGPAIDIAIQVNLNFFFTPVISTKYVIPLFILYQVTSSINITIYFIMFPLFQHMCGFFKKPPNFLRTI
jgi:hypothetical protein